MFKAGLCGDTGIEILKLPFSAASQTDAMARERRGPAFSFLYLTAEQR